ncbi:MAG: hypothetical protein WA110_00375 [Anaerolineaceae bacterium]
MMRSKMQFTTRFILMLVLTGFASSIAPDASLGLVDANTLPELTTTHKVFLPILFKAPPPPPPPAKAVPVGPMGGTFTAVLVDPANSSVMYLGTYGAGVYASTDNGKTWTQKITGLGNTYIQSLAINPQNTQILYAGTYAGGVYKSINGGSNWTASNGSSLANHIVYDLEVDPNNPNILYSASRINGSLVGYVYKSKNSGLSWRLLFSGDQFDSDDYFYDIDINPVQTSEIFLTAHEHGFFKSINSGEAFFAINSGVTDLSARSIAQDPNDPALVYGGVWHGAGIFRSRDEGAHWTNLGNGLPADVEIYRLVLDPLGGPVKPVFACTYKNGLYRSTDMGVNWNSAGLNGQFLYDFAIGSGTPQRWYAATSYRGLYKSVDSGASWATSHAAVSSANITGLASLSNKPGVIYAGVYGLGVMKTSNGGTSWSANNSGLGDFSVSELVAFDGSLYALTSSAVYVSNGDNWSAMNIPQTAGYDPSEYVTAVLNRVSIQEELLLEKMQDQIRAVEESGAQSGNTPLISLTSLNGVLYGGTAGRGLWTYSGGSWYQVGLNGYTIPSLASDESLGRLLVSACDGTGSCSVRALKNGAWSGMNEGLSGLTTNTILVRADDYFAATSSGIFIRDNTGTSWSRVAAKGVNVVSLSYYPQNHCQMAAGAVGSTYYSTNCGTVWQAATGTSLRWNFQSVVFDPTSSDRIMFGSKEAGAFLWTSD